VAPQIVASKVSTPEPIKVAKAKTLNITKGFQVSEKKTGMLLQLLKI